MCLILLYEELFIKYLRLNNSESISISEKMIHKEKVIICIKTVSSWFLVNDQRDAQITFYVLIFIFNPLHVSSTSCSSSGETICVNTTSGNCHYLSVAVSCVGWEWTPFTVTQSDSYQRLYWHNLSLLMMSTMFSKHVES
jgi:hypothetical protein